MQNAKWGENVKHTRKCPKCSGTEILLIEGEIRGDGSGNFIKTGMTLLSAVKVNRYICTACGYSEEWTSPDDIPKLKEKYGLIF